MARMTNLSQLVHTGTPLPSFYPRTCIFPWASREVSKFMAEAMFLTDHVGTHIDAPNHVDPNGKTIDQFPVSRFVAEGVKFDFQHKGPKQFITAKDLQSAEKQVRPIEEGDAVLIQIGWDRYLHDENKYFSNYPGLSRDAAEYIVSKKVNVVGVDGPDVDMCDDQECAPHMVLLPNEVLIVEGLCNLSEVRVKTFKFVFLPIYIKNASGSPTRAIAIEE